jgi:hypothetical protein
VKVRTRTEGGKSYNQTVSESLKMVANTNHSVTLSFSLGIQPKEYTLELTGLELARFADSINAWLEKRKKKDD